MRRLRPMLPRQARRRGQWPHPFPPRSRASSSESGSCRCSDYPHRNRRVPDCIRLTPESVRSIRWLPPTCAYRLVAEGKDLMWWHPLHLRLTGDGPRGRCFRARAHRRLPGRCAVGGLSRIRRSMAGTRAKTGTPEGRRVNRTTLALGDPSGFDLQRSAARRARQYLAPVPNFSRRAALAMARPAVASERGRAGRDYRG